MPAWTFQRRREVVTVDPEGPLIVRISGGVDLAVDAAIAGCGVVQLFEDWLKPHLASGALEPVLEGWWQTFTGPFLYYPAVAICRRRCAPSSTSSESHRAG